MTSTTRLPEPSIRGRLVRFGLGLAIALSLLLTPPVELTDPDGLFWMLLAIAIWEIPGLWETALDLAAGRTVAAVAVTGGLVIGVGSLLAGNEFWSAPLQWYSYAWMTLVLGIQSISFAVAAVIATPGCEWRALPHLIARLRGDRVTPFAACQLHIERLDRASRSRGP